MKMLKEQHEKTQFDEDAQSRAKFKGTKMESCYIVNDLFGVRVIFNDMKMF